MLHSCLQVQSLWQLSFVHCSPTTWTGGISGSDLRGSFRNKHPVSISAYFFLITEKYKHQQQQVSIKQICKVKKNHCYNNNNVNIHRMYATWTFSKTLLPIQQTFIKEIIQTWPWTQTHTHTLARTCKHTHTRTQSCECACVHTLMTLVKTDFPTNTRQ